MTKIEQRLIADARRAIAIGAVNNSAELINSGIAQLCAIQRSARRTDTVEAVVAALTDLGLTNRVTMVNGCLVPR